ncbi:MAG TPA: Sua5/YciO/YrdC/YwlC family protein [Woeseiaceae bacterium]|nr:Sua5/YciO/YrdC/YwlC family protein [Woeseiaceae bacterium]
MRMPVRLAVDALVAGGVIAYPTEGVFGLGCLPDEPRALARLLAIKERDAAKGLILLAADAGHLAGWVADDDLDRLPPPAPAAPVTWLASPGPRISPLLEPLLMGRHATVAVRLAGNPVALAICRGAGMPVTSTSANRSGRPVAANRYLLRRGFAGLVDYVAPGDCGPARGPSEIRVLATGAVVRPARA